MKLFKQWSSLCNFSWRDTKDDFRESLSPLKLSHIREGDVHESAGCERLEALFAREGYALRIGHSDQQAPSVSTGAVQASGGASYEVSFSSCNGSSWWSSTRKEGPTTVADFLSRPLFMFMLLVKRCYCSFYHFIGLRGLYGGVLGGTSKGVWEETTRLQTAYGYSRLDDLLYKDGRVCRAKKGVSRSFSLMKLWTWSNYGSPGKAFLLAQDRSRCPTVMGCVCSMQHVEAVQQEVGAFSAQ